MFGLPGSAKAKRHSVGGVQRPGNTSLKEALRNRGGAKVPVASHSEAEDAVRGRGSSWLDRWGSAMEKQFDRVWERLDGDPEVPLSARSSASEDSAGARQSLMSMAMAGLGGGGAGGSLVASLQSLAGFHSEDPARVGKAPKRAGACTQLSPSAFSPMSLSVVDERGGEEQEPEQEPPSPATVSDSIAREAQVSEARRVVAVETGQPRSCVDSTGISKDTSATRDSGSDKASSDKVRGSVNGTWGIADKKSALEVHGKSICTAPAPTQFTKQEIIFCPQNLASLGVDAWWLHEGKKSAQREELADKELKVELKADPRLDRGGLGVRDVGRLNTLQEFWGNAGKKAHGFAAEQLHGSTSKLSKGEAEASLQRHISAGSDFDEVRRLRKLISEMH